MQDQYQGLMQAAQQAQLAQAQYMNAEAARPLRSIEAANADSNTVNAMLAQAYDRLTVLADRLLGALPTQMTGSSSKPEEVLSDVGALGRNLQRSRDLCERLHEACSRLEAL